MFFTLYCRKICDEITEITSHDQIIKPKSTHLSSLACGLSSKTDRLAQHICAFSNHQGGGMFVYGINDDATFTTLNKEQVDQIVRKLGNIAHNNLSNAIDIDHTILEYEGHPVLFVYVP